MVRAQQYPIRQGSAAPPILSPALRYCAGGKFVFADDEEDEEEEEEDEEKKWFPRKQQKSNPLSLTCFKTHATLRGF
jgi:hypothetical protein